ncbi:uncharacterized protein [Haliotis asinina]|uniref:uncharacterized protein isoform X3 n=1 Tax=Haliotis asinina TaxID=109174 RepID=UPI0035325A3A
MAEVGQQCFKCFSCNFEISSRDISCFPTLFARASLYLHFITESLSDRARVRKELSGDESWVTNYIAAVGPMWARQENTLLTLKQGTHLNLSNITPGGVYELQTLPDGSRVGSLLPGTKLLGAFQTVFGQVHKEYRLLHHTSIDDAVQASHSSLEGVSGEVFTRLLTPAPWSTLQ